jgi:hypothetical protein
MTRDEALDVLGILTAAWPNAKHGDDTVELWIQYLAQVGYQDARAVASELVLSEDWMPPIARFRQALVARRRHAIERGKFAERSLPSGEVVTDAATACAHIAAIRAQGVAG